MSKKLTPHNLKWTFEACKEEVLKYNSLKDFKKMSQSCYNAILKNKWKDLLCSHLTCEVKPNGYWSYERCKEEFKKYSNCRDLTRHSGVCKSIAVGHGWYKELSTHFVRLGHKYKRFLYSCEFADNSVYIGLTYNTSKRFQSHLKEGSVYNHIIDCDCLPTFKILTEKPVDVDEAVGLEEYYLQKYKSEGWNTLNRAKTGSIGGNAVKWTFEAVKKEALKYKSRSEFENNCSSAYNASLKRKWTDDVCQHMSPLKKPSGYWQIYENCKNEALKYDSMTEFQNKAPGAHKASTKFGWLDSMRRHMKEVRKPNGYYTKEKCIEIVKECSSKEDLKIKNASVYFKLYSKKWMNELEKYFKNEKNTISIPK